MKAEGIATLVVLLILGALLILLQSSFVSMQQLCQLALFRKKHHQAFWYAKGVLSYGQQVIKKHRGPLDQLLAGQQEIKCTINTWPLDKSLQALLFITKQADQYVLTSQLIQQHKIIFSLKEKLRFEKDALEVQSFTIVTV